MRRIVRLALFLSVSIGLAFGVKSTAWAVPAARRQAYRLRFLRAWSSAILRLLALRVESRGRVPDGPCLFVSNHLGYLDIPVLSAVIPSSFVSKDDVRRWPLIGFLAEAAGTVFISRETPRRAAAALAEMRKRLLAGDSVLVFPEGTSSRGESVLPFRSFPFAAAEGLSAVRIAPVRIDLRRIDGEAADGEIRDLACWHGDMDFARHFWRFLGTRGAAYRVSFGEPVPAGTQDRKSAARAAHERVIAMEGKCI